MEKLSEAEQREGRRPLKVQSVEFLESLFLLVLLWSDPTFLKFSKQTNITHRVSVPAITEEAKDLSLELGVSADADGWLWETF